MNPEKQKCEEVTRTCYPTTWVGLRREFYLELEKEKEVTVRLDEKDCTVIHLKGEKKKLDEFFYVIGLAEAILKRREIQAVAEAMVYAGSTDTGWLTTINLVEVWIKGAVKVNKQHIRQYKTIRKSLKKRIRNAE